MASTDATPPVSWATNIRGGQYERKQSVFRDWVKADGSSDFVPESGRYHLYVSLACPWAHRTLFVRAIKGLQAHIGVTAVDWANERGGWPFNPERRGCQADPINNKASLREIYLMINPDYSANFTVPVLFDRKHNTIVNNESSEIIRMLNSEFNAFCATEAQRNIDLYPADLWPKIDEINEWVYSTVNNGVYRTGFATTQEAYEENFDRLFASLDRLEKILSENRYLTGQKFTEADVRLWTTLLRFDPVYVQHFKCNLRRLVDYPNLHNYMLELYTLPGVRDTVDFEHIKKHYMLSHKTINPLGIVAKGPLLDMDAPHNRARLPGQPVLQ